MKLKIMRHKYKKIMTFFATACLVLFTQDFALASGEREDELDEAWLRSFNYILYIAKSPKTGKLESICLQDREGATIIPTDPINEKFNQSLSHLRLTQSAGISEDIETEQSSVIVCESIHFDAYADTIATSDSIESWAITISVCKNSSKKNSTIRYRAQKMIDPYGRVKDGDVEELSEKEAKPDKKKPCPNPSLKYEYNDKKGFITNTPTGIK